MLPPPVHFFAEALLYLVCLSAKPLFSIKALEYDRGQYEKGFHDGRMYVPPCPSNADRIRAMTDEEMADLFDTWIRDCDSNDVPCRTFCLQGCSNCEKNWLRWLKQKAEDGK